jgi:ABC-type dipeptide/oligopeptide/nickel transport system permease component
MPHSGPSGACAMYSYIVRRLAFGLVTVFAVSVLVFVILRVLPGDPLVAMFGMEGFMKLSDAERASYMAQLGLSDPLWLQYCIGCATSGAAIWGIRSSAPRASAT